MLYLATASTAQVREAMHHEAIGQMVTQQSANRLEPNVPWALDNGCFSSTWKEVLWFRFLERYASEPHCLFAVVPDVVADADATRVRWEKYSEDVKALGYPAAYVLQDGETGPPWDEMSALFIGGSTHYKLSDEARRFGEEAKTRGLWLHMGRVNSLTRLEYAQSMGCDSADGTILAFGPATNLPRVKRMVQTVNRPTLFDEAQ